MTDPLNFKPEVTYGFINDPDDLFKPTTENIVLGIVGNPAFPNSQAKALIVKTLFLAYSPTVVDPERRNSLTAAARVAARTPLEVALRDLLPDIQAESGGDMKALLSTNIPLARNPETPGMPFTPVSIELYLFGSPEQLYAKCEVQKNSKLYIARISRDETNWLWHNSDTRAAVSFTGLPVGEKLYVQMMVRNSVATSEWSNSKPFIIPEPGLVTPKRKRPRGVK